MRLPQLTFGKVLAGTAVALVVTTGTAYAHGMVNSGDIVNGSIRSVDIGNSQVRTADIQNSTIRRSDLAFDVPVTLAALVQSNGTLSRGIGAISANNTSTGVYTVTFNRSVAGCFANVTGTGDQHDEMASSLSGSTVTVDIEDPDEEDVQNNSSFFLTVVCPA